MKKNLLLWPVVLLAGIYGYSCSDSEPDEPKNTITVTPSSLDIPARDTGEHELTVKTDDGDFTYEEQDAQWLDVARSGDVITVSARGVNDTGEDRVARLIFKAENAQNQTVTITHKKAGEEPGEYRMALEADHDYDILNFPAEGDYEGGFKFKVDTNIPDPLKNITLTERAWDNYTKYDFKADLDYDQGQLYLYIYVGDNTNNNLQKDASVELSSSYVTHTVSVIVTQQAGFDPDKNPILGYWTRCQMESMFNTFPSGRNKDRTFNNLTVHYDKNDGYYRVSYMSNYTLHAVVHEVNGKFYVVDNVEAGYHDGEKYIQRVYAVDRSSGSTGVERSFGSEFMELTLNDTGWTTVKLWTVDGVPYLPVVVFIKESDGTMLDALTISANDRKLDQI